MPLWELETLLDAKSPRCSFVIVEKRQNWSYGFYLRFSELLKYCNSYNSISIISPLSTSSFHKSADLKIKVLRSVATPTTCPSNRINFLWSQNGFVWHHHFLRKLKIFVLNTKRRKNISYETVNHDVWGFDIYFDE